MEKHRNSIEFEVAGRYALFSDAATRVGGEKFSYQVPTYQALKGITESIYWKPTLYWVVDAVRVMERVRTESKGIRPIKMNGGNELSFYTYLRDVRYQVLAHFEWNEQRSDLKEDRIENKHYEIAKRSVMRGGRRDIFLGTRECQGYVEPCKFGSGEGFYDNYGGWNLGYMFYGFSYPDENREHNFVAKFWSPTMTNGIINFPDPSSGQLVSRTIRDHVAVKQFILGENLHPIKIGEEK